MLLPPAQYLPCALLNFITHRPLHPNKGHLFGLWDVPSLFLRWQKHKRLTCIVDLIQERDLRSRSAHRIVDIVWRALGWKAAGKRRTTWNNDVIESHGISTEFQEACASPAGGSQEFDEQTERIPLIRLFK